MGHQHPEVATHFNNLAGFYLELGQISKATEFCRRALEIREKTFPPDHPFIAKTLRQLGDCYIRTEELSRGRDRLSPGFGHPGEVRTS